jgi:hypothetical protein
MRAAPATMLAVGASTTRSATAACLLQTKSGAATNAFRRRYKSMSLVLQEVARLPSCKRRLLELQMEAAGAASGGRRSCKRRSHELQTEDSGATISSGTSCKRHRRSYKGREPECSADATEAVKDERRCCKLVRDATFVFCSDECGAATYSSPEASWRSCGHSPGSSHGEVGRWSWKRRPSPVRCAGVVVGGREFL